MPNPIITRELVGMLRTKKALAWQVAVVAILSLLVVMRWPSDARVNASGQQAQQVLRLFGYGLMIVVILLTPVFPATSIVRERQRGTLALLLNSPMTAWGILTGKLLGSMGFILLLLSLSLPAAAATFTMGGVRLSQVTLVYVLVFLAALQYGSIALWISSRSGTIDGALRGTFAVIIALAIVPLLLMEFIPKDQPMPYGPAAFFEYLGNVPAWADKQQFAWLPQGLGSTAFSVILYIVVILTYVSRFFSPAPAMTNVLQDEALLAGDAGDTGSVVLRYAIVGLISAAIFLWLTARRLRPDMLDRARDAGKITNERSTATKAYRRFMFMWFFDPQRRSGMIGPLSNPVMVKEFRTRRFGRSHWLMRLFAICLLLSLGLMFAITQKTEDPKGTALPVLVLLQATLVLLITPALAAGLISTERESGGWALLQLTPMSATRIVIGKLLSVILPLLLVLIATLPGYGVILFINASGEVPDSTLPPPLSWIQQFIAMLGNSPHTAQIIQIQITLLLTAVFAMLLSAVLSAIYKRTSTATAMAYTILGVICVGTMLIRFAENAPFSHGLVETVLTINPLAAVLAQIRAPILADYPSVPGVNRVFLLVACAALVVALVARVRTLTRPQ
ncbi:MAG: ABC transporter permease subunit [Phycisphaeraceae bacterium]